MAREIFRKVPLSEKKQMFKEGSESKLQFFAKGDGDELVKLFLDEFVDGKVLVLNYMPGSPKFSGNQTVVLNFSYGEDRFFMHTQAEAFNERVHIDAAADVYILQRRKTPRLEIPPAYPGSFNIIEHQKKSVFLECPLQDFSSGGCRIIYKGHLPQFKVGDVLKGVLHLNHRNPVELEAEIKHHVMDAAKGEQSFGMQFKMKTSILENKMLVVFMDLQRELFIKWSGKE